MEITLTELEDAINYWRVLRPSSGEEHALSREVNALANVYAMMIIERSKSVIVDRIDPMARELLDTWRRERAAAG
jgi:hypothetical protein